MVDSLVEVPLEKWPELLKIFQKTWTVGVPSYYAIHLNINYPAIREAFKFKIYSAYGNIGYGLVAITVKETLECVIMPVADDTTKLEDALVGTKLIDWTEKLCVDLLTEKAISILKNLFRRLNIKEVDIMPTSTFFFDRNMARFPERSPPEGTYLAPVKSEHIEKVDSTWPYKNSWSKNYFSTLAANDLSYGLYSQKHEDLVAWVFLNEYKFITHLYCVESQKKNGCAMYLLEKLVNDQLLKGEDAYGFVVVGNEKSLRLFQKLGFKMIEDVCWTFLNM